LPEAKKTSSACFDLSIVSESFPANKDRNLVELDESNAIPPLPSRRSGQHGNRTRHRCYYQKRDPAMLEDGDSNIYNLPSLLHVFAARLQYRLDR